MVSGPGHRQAGFTAQSGIRLDHSRGSGAADRRDGNALGARKQRAELTAKEAELKKVERQIRKIIDAVKDGLYHASMKDEMTGLEDRKIALERELEVADEPPPLLHTNMSKVYSRKINALYEALRSEEGRPAAADLLRTLIDRIILEPGDDRFGILIKGDIAGILSFASAKKELPATAVCGRQVPVVAGARNRRQQQGLFQSAA